MSSGSVVNVDFLPGVPFDKSKTFRSLLCESVKKNGPKQYYPIYIVANACNRAVAGSDIPWDKFKTTSGLLYRQGVVAEYGSVYTLANKVLSLGQAGMEKKYDTDFKTKVTLLKVEDIQDEEVNVIYANTDPKKNAHAELDHPCTFVDENNELWEFPEQRDEPVVVGYQAVAKMSKHKHPMRYVSWRQFVVNDAKVNIIDGNSVLEKNLGAKRTSGVAGKMTLTKDQMKEAVKEVTTAVSEYNDAVWEYIKGRARQSKEDAQVQMTERIKGALRGLKAAHCSRKNRKTPKAQSSRTKVGLHGLGKATPRTKSQGSRSAGKKKGVVDKTIRTLEEALNPNKKTGKAVDLKSVAGLVSMIESILWLQDTALDDLKRGLKEALTSNLKDQLKAIAEEKDLYGDSRNFVPMPPIVDLMMLTDRPDLFTKTGPVFALEAQKELARRSGGYCVTSVNALPAREQGLRAAAAMIVQTVSVDVTLAMIDDKKFSNHGLFPGWNSPFEGSEFTCITEGTVVSIHRNIERPPVVRLPKSITRGLKTGTCINATGSSLIGLEGTFIAQTESASDSPRLTIAEAYTAAKTVTQRQGRGGWVTSNGDTLVDVEYSDFRLRMRNPQQIGHWCLTETVAQRYQFGDYGFGPEEVAKGMEFMRDDKTVVSDTYKATLIDTIYHPGHPEATDADFVLQVVPRKIWDELQARPIIGSSGLADGTNTKPRVLQSEMGKAMLDASRFVTAMPSVRPKIVSKRRTGGNIKKMKVDVGDFDCPQEGTDKDYSEEWKKMNKLAFKKQALRRAKQFAQQERKAGRRAKGKAFREIDCIPAGMEIEDKDLDEAMDI